MRRTSRKPACLLQFHSFGSPCLTWAVIIRAADAYAAMGIVRSRYGEDQSCCVVRFP